MQTYDAIVIGLGGMGSSALFHLAGRGLRVLGLDALHPPHDRGSSHGETRVIRQAYYEHPAYVPLLLRAYELWRDLERLDGDPLLLLPGGLMMGAPASEVFAGSLHSARQHSLPHDVLDTVDIRRRFPQFQVPDGTVALFEHSAGLVFCERAVAAHLAHAASRGADVRFNEPVTAWRIRQSGVEVTTATGSYQTEHLILTPGPWAPDLLRDLGLPLRVERQVLCWFDPPGGIEPFQPGRFPIFIWQPAADTTPYGFPAVDGPHGGVKVAFYRKPFSETCSPDTIDRRIRTDDESALRSVLREFLPSLNGKLLRATTCLYTLTPDLHFIIDSHPAHENVFLAAGFSGHGFKFCSVVGEILADWVKVGRSSFDLDLFAIRRFEPAQGAAS